jgi:hypothetical protein
MARLVAEKEAAETIGLPLATFRAWVEVGRLPKPLPDCGLYDIKAAEAKIPALSLPSAITPKAVYTVTMRRIPRARSNSSRFSWVVLGRTCLRSTASRYKRWRSRGMRAPCRKT